MTTRAILVALMIGWATSPLAPVGVLFAQGAGARTPVVRSAAPAGRVMGTVSSTGQARIDGVVITRDEPPKPVKRAAVRARDVGGRISGTTNTDDAGHFSFALDRAGSYYVELVDDDGRVLAVEDVGQVTISVSPGQVSTTILRVPTRMAAAAWGRTASTILGAASAAGVGALVSSGQPASPER
jgi:hypothetical protein